MIIWPCRVRLMSWAWWSSSRRMICDERMRGLIRSSSLLSIPSRMAAPAARVSDWSGECTSRTP